jgi:hypothetical protein
MTLQLLRKTPILALYYDSGNDWLFADWQGELTLATVQEACLELANCVLQRPYARVLNSNAQVTTVQWEVAAWLVEEFMPYLGLAGVEKLAWVCAPNLRSRNVVHTILNRLPLLQLALFDELDEAVVWLQRNPEKVSGGASQPLHPYPAKLTLTRAVQELEYQLREKVASANQA